ncbi:metallophosphoesterase family protein [candidate division KSB1 bacterium]|nr:metallophosphoesterase family protein [candidate division KSB1 bacterium]
MYKDIHAGLDALLDNSRVKQLALTPDSKFVLLSDLHLGNGKRCDNIANNEEVLALALQYYHKLGFSVILAGDVEDLWQFSLKSILGRYGDTIIERLNAFGPQRLMRIYGNHDIRWRKNSNFPLKVMDDTAYEGIRLDDWIIITHGHQGCGARLLLVLLKTMLVRAFRLVEPLALALGWGNITAPQSQIPRDREKAIYKWAKKNRKLVICGHTHRAIFAARHYVRWLEEQIRDLAAKLQALPDDHPDIFELQKLLVNYESEWRTEKKRGRDYAALEENDAEVIPCYFNIGSALYRRGITCIEIENGVIRLVKWSSEKGIAVEKSRQLLWNECSLAELKTRIVQSTFRKV